MLDLRPMPGEGGFYRESYRCQEIIEPKHLPARYHSAKSFSTAIYFLITPDTFSSLHRLPSDEVFHFYLGDPVTMLQLHPDGRAETFTLGQDIQSGQLLQCVVPADSWQGMFLNEGDRFALMGTTVAPGFDFQDIELGDREALIEAYPGCASLIKRLTK